MSHSFGWPSIPIDEVHIHNHKGNLIRNLETEPFVWNGRAKKRALLSDVLNYQVVRSGHPGKHFRNLSGYINVLGEKNNVKN